ncbi:MAG: hypothetical protein ACRDYB_14290 [Acidimicrobiales bacterium]
MPPAEIVLQARQGECVMARLGKPVLGLPEVTPFDREPGAKCMVDSSAEETVSIGLSRPCLLDCIAEQEAKARTRRSELCFRAKREVDLEVARQKEDAVDRPVDGTVEEHDTCELIAHDLSPVIEYFLDGEVASDTEGKVDVGEAVDVSLGPRSDDGARYDARVGVGAI